MKKSQIPALIFIVIVVFIVFEYFNNNHSNEISGADIVAYIAQCYEKSATSFNECTNPVALPRKAFKVDEGSSSVISWYPDYDSPSFIERKDCTIVNKDNWSCGGYTFGFGFKEGVYFDGYSNHVISISKNDWDSINQGKPTPPENFPTFWEV